MRLALPKFESFDVIKEKLCELSTLSQVHLKTQVFVNKRSLVLDTL